VVQFSTHSIDIFFENVQLTRMYLLVMWRLLVDGATIMAQIVIVGYVQNMWKQTSDLVQNWIKCFFVGKTLESEVQKLKR
jgi:hypothetical protein